MADWIGNRPLAGTLINHAHRLSHGLVGCWPLSETAGTRANDAARGRYGSLSGFYPGPWNTAYGGILAAEASSGPRTGLRFSGEAAEYIEIPSSPLYDSPSGTWALWMKTRQGVPSYALLMARGDASQHLEGITLAMESGTAKLFTQVKSAGGVVLQLTGTTVLNDDREHMVGITFGQNSGDPGALWVDGRLEASGTNSGAWAFNSQVVRLGLGIDSFWAQYGGALGIVRWYNRMLSADDWGQLYANPYSGFADTDDGAFLAASGGGASKIPVFMHHYQQQRQVG